jgi:hypothetical protein
VLTRVTHRRQDENVRTAEVMGWFMDADEAVKRYQAAKSKEKANDGEQESDQKAPSVLYAYLQTAFKRQKRLNEHETLAIARSLGPQSAHLIAISAATGRVRTPLTLVLLLHTQASSFMWLMAACYWRQLTCTEALGDLMAQLNQPLIAADIYMRAHVLDKVRLLPCSRVAASGPR